MDAALSRLESVLGSMEKASAPARSCEERLDDIVARMEKIVGARGSFAASRALGPPRVELQSMGNIRDHRWVVENQVHQKDIVMKATSLKQSLHVFGCRDSVIRVEGKVNRVTIDKCSKTSIFLQDIVGSCEVLNCDSLKLQIQGCASTLLVDHSMGCQLYLGKGAVGAEITTARSSGVQVQGLGDARFDVEDYGIPEQFITKVVDGECVTTPVPSRGCLGY